jgi:thiamine biosynthesis lipoprotein
MRLAGVSAPISPTSLAPPTAPMPAAPKRVREPLRLAIEAMATRFELVLPEVPASVAGRARLTAAGEAALDEVRAVDARWSLFRRDSFLNHLVANAHRTPVRLDEDDFELLDAAARVHAASGGAFDPCAAPLLGEGFGRPRHVADAARTTFADLELDATQRTVRSRAPGFALDLGGIAKGHALDRAARVLQECGVRAALLHGGTSAVVALGSPEAATAHPGPCGWRVRLGSAPGAPVVTLCDAVLALSAVDGRRDTSGRGHVVDPRPGTRAQHVEHTSESAVVVPLDRDPAAAALGDALATALLVTGAAIAPTAFPAAAQALRPRVGGWTSVAGPVMFGS